MSPLVALVVSLAIGAVTAFLVHRIKRLRIEIRFLRSELDLMGRKAWEPSTYRIYARDAFEASHRRLP